MNNRLYCTFVEPNEVKEVSEKIQSSYKVLFDKIFVLESLDGDKVMLTIAPRLINKKVMIGVQFGAKKDFITYVKRPIESTGSFLYPYIFNLWLTMANIIALIQIYIINRFLYSEIEVKLSKI